MAARWTHLNHVGQVSQRGGGILRCVGERDRWCKPKVGRKPTCMDTLGSAITPDHAGKDRPAAAFCLAPAPTPQPCSR